MSWAIQFFKNSRGDEIVKDLIRSLQKPTISKVAHHIDLLSTQGPILPMPYSKKLQKKKLKLLKKDCPLDLNITYMLYLKHG